MLNDIYLDQRHAPFNTTYLQRMLGVIDNAIAALLNKSDFG